MVETKMKEYSLPYGGSSIRLSIPDKYLAEEIKPDSDPARYQTFRAGAESH